MFGFHYYFGIWHKCDGRVVSLHFTPKEIPWYSFLSEAEGTQGLQEVDRLCHLKVNFSVMLYYLSPSNRLCLFVADVPSIVCPTYVHRGTAVAQWLRCCATKRKVAGSIPAGVTGF